MSDIQFQDGELIAGGVKKLDSVLTQPGQALFFRRQLEYIVPEIYRKRLPVLNGMRLISVDTKIPDGAQNYTFRLYETSGVANFISDYAADANPVDVSGREQTFNIRDIGDSYSYSFREIAAAQMGNFPLDAEKGLAARRAIEELHNRICWYGDAQKGLHGIINYPYAPRSTFPVPISDASTGNQIVNAINNLVYGVIRRTNGREGSAKNLVLVLPIQEYTHVHSRRMDSGTDTTVAEFILRNNRSLAAIEMAHELANDDNDPLNPLGATERYAFVYDPDDRVVSYKMPTPFTQLPAEPKNFAMLINCHSSSGGICMKYPLATVLAELPQP